MAHTHPRTIATIDGVAIEEVVLTSAAASVRVMTWGAVVRDMVVQHRGQPQRVVLGLAAIEDYPVHSPHFGAIAGRFANRIGYGRFTLDGVPHQLSLNQPDPVTGAPKHHLHGGTAAFGKRPWTILDHGPAHVTLGLVSPDGDGGYPGAVTATCTYRLLDPAILAVELTATATQPTIVNLAQHSYFNLDGSADIRDHRLTLDCDFRTPTDADLIPTGEIIAVAGTAYDYATPQPMGRMIDGARVRFDGNFVRRQRGFGRTARVESPVNGLTLECWTDQPAVQFYDGAKINVTVPGLDGKPYGAFAGFCLEPQRFPDSPNRPHFTDATLRPGEVYRQRTEYRFG
jgi:aldose 1-epimerase